jgi:hypothetical protein
MRHACGIGHGAFGNRAAATQEPYCMLDAPIAPAIAGDEILSDTHTAPTAKPRDRSKDRAGERVRYRPGTREARRLVGSRKDRVAFLELLARHGDPAVAADQLGLPLFVLFRHRDADPAFAAEWLAAVQYAWERVESRVLAALLGQLADKDGKIDTRLALAIVGRRDKPVTHQGAVKPYDGAGAARLRAELRALAGLNDAEK